jgi:L-rhamnose mutarotase
MTARVFRMKLKPGTVDAYRVRHDEIWPELSKLLSDAGIYDYSIFLDEATLDLFAVMKLRAGHDIASLPDHPVMRKWWDYMAELMEVESGNRPKEWPLTQVFHMP